MKLLSISFLFTTLFLLSSCDFEHKAYVSHVVSLDRESNHSSSPQLYPSREVSVVVQGKGGGSGEAGIIISKILVTILDTDLGIIALVFDGKDISQISKGKYALKTQDLNGIGSTYKIQSVIDVDSYGRISGSAIIYKTNGQPFIGFDFIR